VDERARQSFDAIGRLFDRMTSWLAEIGKWIFGGLIAINLVVMSSLLTIGPTDAAVQTAIILFACALPMNLAGLVVLRLTKDLMDFGVDDLAHQAFKESGFAEIDAYFAPAPERAALVKRRTSVALRYSLAIAAISATLTLAGLVAALWHMAWWIGSVFLVMVALSAAVVLGVLALAQPPATVWENSRQRRIE